MYLNAYFLHNIPCLGKARCFDDSHIVQPGETREQKQDMVYVNEEGVQRHVKGIDDKLTVRQKAGPAPGKTMAILGGRHADMLCEVS